MPQYSTPLSTRPLHGMPAAYGIFIMNAYAATVALAWNAADSHPAYAWVMRNAARQVEAKSTDWKPECATIAPVKPR